jgi:hypothetical protein
MGDSLLVRQRDARENSTPSESRRHEDSVRGDVYSVPGTREMCAPSSGSRCPESSVRGANSVRHDARFQDELMPRPMLRRLYHQQPGDSQNQSQQSAGLAAIFVAHSLFLSRVNVLIVIISTI